MVHTGAEAICAHVFPQQAFDVVDDENLMKIYTRNTTSHRRRITNNVGIDLSPSPYHTLMLSYCNAFGKQIPTKKCKWRIHSENFHMVLLARRSVFCMRSSILAMEQSFLRVA